MRGEGNPAEPEFRERASLAVLLISLDLTTSGVVNRCCRLCFDVLTLPLEPSPTRCLVKEHFTLPMLYCQFSLSITYMLCQPVCPALDLVCLGVLIVIPL